jgi:hypothetical protein
LDAARGLTAPTVSKIIEMRRIRPLRPQNLLIPMIMPGDGRPAGWQAGGGDRPAG